MNLHEYLNEKKNIVEDALKKIIYSNRDTPKIYESMNYSLFAGGKRLRPIIAIMACELFDGNIDEVMPFACCLEIIHTYSLIHDDLPAMDNDDYRRNKPTNHKMYGEAMAILAGDALLTYAFELMTRNTLNYSDNQNNNQDNNQSDNRDDYRGDSQGYDPVCNFGAEMKAINYIARASGAVGMIRGQVIDLESENYKISGELLEYMHKCKTGAILKASVLVPAILLGTNNEHMARLDEYSDKIGLAFQIKDDILDVEGNCELLGKETGVDITKNKSTFTSLYGIEKAKAILNELTDKAVQALDIFEVKGEFLRDMAYFISNRKY